MLLSCVREHDWSRPVESLQTLVNGRDLSVLAHRAVAHRVPSPVLHSISGLVGIDPDAVARLQAHHVRGLARQMLAGAELAVVANALSAAGLRWVVVKGPVVAHTAYTRPDLRTYADIDVLVDPSGYCDAVTALESIGAQVLDRNWDLLCQDQRGQVHLRLPGGTPLDLHWNLVNRGSERPLLGVRTGSLLDAARQVEVAGLTVPTLEPASTLAHLCLHAGLSGGDRLGWLKDVDRAVVNLAPEWPEVVERAREWRARLLVGLVLRRAALVLATPVPPWVLRALVPARAAQVAHLVDTLWPVPRSTTGWSALHAASMTAGDTWWSGEALRRRHGAEQTPTDAAWGALRRQCLHRPSPEFTISSGHRDRYFALVRNGG